jgi:nitroimidazol reductase NimA-like FMN-containing flavoprotein (pyridoxamine 5'-phosphate oxidase superfamily)
MDSNFIKLKNEVFDTLNNNKHIVLATSFENNVTARTISYIMIKDELYFQTLSTYEKALQIKNNSNVALCLDNLQITGTAQILNHPSENNEFLQKYKQIHNNAYNKYSMLENEVVIKVKFNKASLWKYENNSGHKIVIDLVKKEYWNE